MFVPSIFISILLISCFSFVLSWRITRVSPTACLSFYLSYRALDRHASTRWGRHPCPGRRAGSPGDRLRRQFRRTYAQLSFLAAPSVKRQLHVPVTGGQTVSVMVATKHHNRGNLPGPRRPRCRSARGMRSPLAHPRSPAAAHASAVRLEQVRREKDLPNGNAEIGISARKHAGIRGHQRKRWIVGPNQSLAVLAREEHRRIRQQRRRPVQTSRHRRSWPVS